MGSMEDAVASLNLILQWMATDREEKRVAREENRHRHETLRRELEELKDLVVQEQNTREEQQARMEEYIRSLQHEVMEMKRILERTHNDLVSAVSSPKMDAAPRSPTLSDHTRRLEDLRSRVNEQHFDQRDEQTPRTHPPVAAPRATQQVRVSDVPTIPSQTFLGTVNSTFRQGEVAEPDHNKQIPLMQYDGSIPWERYWVHVETVALANNWSQGTCRMMIAGNLRGEALEFYGLLDDDVKYNYPQMLEALQRRFGQKQSTSALQVQLYNRRQKPAERARDFAAAIQRLGRDAHPKWPSDVIEEICLNQFLKGLVDSELQCAVRDRYPANLRRAVEIAEGLEANREAVRESRKYLSPSPRIRSAVHVAKRDGKDEAKQSGNEEEST